MAIGKLSSRTRLRDVVTGHVVVVRRRLAEVVGRPLIRAWHLSPGILDPAILFTEVRYVGQPITGASVDDRG